MVWNNLGVCYIGNMIKLFMKECVCGIFCVVSEQHINSLRLRLICVISFSSQSSLHFTFHSYLSAASAYYYFPCLCFSLSPALFVFLSWSRSLWFPFFPIQYLSASSSVVLLASCLFSLPMFWFHFAWATLKENLSGISHNAPFKLLACTRNPPKS